jgi:hypothetical protein
MASFSESSGECYCESNLEDDFICDSFASWTTYKTTKQDTGYDALEFSTQIIGHGDCNEDGETFGG